MTISNERDLFHRSRSSESVVRVGFFVEEEIEDRFSTLRRHAPKLIVFQLLLKDTAKIAVRDVIC
jgi:hypothetical protein